MNLGSRDYELLTTITQENLNEADTRSARATGIIDCSIVLTCSYHTMTITGLGIKMSKINFATTLENFCLLHLLLLLPS